MTPVALVRSAVGPLGLRLHFDGTRPTFFPLLKPMSYKLFIPGPIDVSDKTRAAEPRIGLFIGIN